VGKKFNRPWLRKLIDNQFDYRAKTKEAAQNEQPLFIDT